jgi:hypothetical protein
LNNVAHVGGFLSGICAGLVFLPRMVRTPKANERYAMFGDIWSISLFLIGLVGLVLIFPGGLYLLSIGVNIATPTACRAFLSVNC